MRSASASCLLALLAGACRSAPTPRPGTAAPAIDSAGAFALMAEVDRVAEEDLWPGFDPRAVPAVIDEGGRTLLFRHPSPPAGFQAVPGREGVWVFAGRHPSVTANTSVELGGVLTATLMPPTDGAPPAGRAGVLVHEMFHVFQRQRHPGWSGNEAELFVYPVDDGELLALRRMETEALRRALAARDAEGSACWARAALGLRWERFARLPPGPAAYERGTELNEGLATYVQHRVTGDPDADVLPAEGFAPEAVRQQGYRTGLALARLLDRFSPAWRTTLEQDDSRPLDALLTEALADGAGGAPPCAFTTVERDRIRSAAGADVAALNTRRAGQRRAFLEQPGWRLVVVAREVPLFPQAFDPLNVQIVERGEVLHGRFLRLGNDAGTVEVLGRAALTEAAGEHPLFNGVRALTVAGLPDEPAVTAAGGAVTVRAGGVSAELKGATVERSGRTVTVRCAS